MELNDLNEDMNNLILFYWKDRTGRGFTGDMSLNNILEGQEDEDEVNWDGEQLHEWARNASIGDVWENASDYYIRTH